LTGIPTVRASSARVKVSRADHPDTQALRFALSEKTYLPGQWKDIFSQLLRQTDALFVPGGTNIPAAMYGEKQLAGAEGKNPLRALYERALLNYLLDGPKAALRSKPQYPIIGFCLGLQTINVALGGTLVQSIPLEIYKTSRVETIAKRSPDAMHRNHLLALHGESGELYPGWFHRIRVVGLSRFFLAEGTPYVLSNHNQAVKRLGDGLMVVARSMDGRVVEGIQHTRFPNVVGVQFHPERKFAQSALVRYPKDTRRFHDHFWQQVRELIRASHARRTKTNRAPNQGQRKASILNHRLERICACRS
jgi:gamma-glutamyl-gamma-aminobutyrate hydrolase PuuD